MTRIKINSHFSHSVYRLYGNNEDTLTKSLGYVVMRNQYIAKQLLKLCGIKHLKNFEKMHQSKDFLISLQYNRDIGITDIEMRFKNRFHVIIEAKLYNDVPSSKQIRKYLKALNKSSSNKKSLVILTHDKIKGKNSFIKLIDENKFDSIKFKAIGWNEIYSILNKATKRTNNYTDSFMIDELIKFIEEDYHMADHYYDNEVWVVTVNPEKEIGNTGLTFWDFPFKYNLYWHPEDRNRRKCIYMAPKYYGEFSSIFKIKEIKNGYPIDEVKKLENIDWAHNLHEIFYLGPQINLPHKVNFSGRGHTYCSIEDILLKDEL